ncbi:VOC family protein, partial [Streptomyces umbrinus]
MGIQRIESVTYGIDNVDECARFFDDFGLFPVERTDEHAVFETLTGQTLHLDSRPGPRLPPPVEAGPTLREVVWGIDTTQELRSRTSTRPRSRAPRCGWATGSCSPAPVTRTA